MSFPDHTPRTHLWEGEKLFQKITELHEAQLQMCLHQKETSSCVLRLQAAIENLITDKNSTFNQ